DGRVNSLVDLAARRGLDFVRIYDTNTPNYYAAGPQDFVGLVDASELVITDSYHAVVFALLFGKDCLLIPREGLQYSMYSRFETLAELLGVEFIAGEDETAPIQVARDSDRLATELAQRRDEFHSYLTTALAATSK